MKLIKNLESDEICSSFLVEVDGERKYLQIFDTEVLESFNLYKTIEYNEYVMTSIEDDMDFVYPSSFLKTTS